MKGSHSILFLLLCLSLSLLLTAGPCLAEAADDLSQVQQSLEDNLAQSGELLGLIDSGPSPEQIQSALERLPDLDSSRLDNAIGSGAGGQQTPQLTGSAYDLNGLDSTSNVNLIFAKLQMELAQQSKDQAASQLKAIEQLQRKQKDAAGYLQEARRLQRQAEEKKAPVPMPELMTAFLDSRNLRYPKPKNGGFDSDGWDAVTRNLETYTEKLGTDIQTQMVYIQDFMGQYNRYTQGANSAIQSGMQTLTSVARGQSLFSQEGGAFSGLPVATSLIIGLLLGMGIMWLIQRKKIAGPAQEKQK